MSYNGKLTVENIFDIKFLCVYKLKIFFHFIYFILPYIFKVGYENITTVLSLFFIYSKRLSIIGIPISDIG